MSYLDTVGRIFNIQRFSIHDGEGVRTIVFLKGCFMRCKWCCNPESQMYDIQTMHYPDGDKTVGYDISVREILETVEKDRVYYNRSRGGVTLSGGECLCQADFSAALLRACKERDITTAIETTGCAPFSQIEKLLPYVDTFLMDIKHMNSEKHKQFTTKPNDLILENASKLGTLEKELIVRVPVIPGFNDTEEEIGDIAGFASGLPVVKEIHLLPYHKLGKDKYTALGREYTMGDAPLIPKEKMQLLKAAAERGGRGLICTIGG